MVFISLWFDEYQWGLPLDREVSGRSGFGQLAEVLSFASALSRDPCNTPLKY